MTPDFARARAWLGRARAMRWAPLVAVIVALPSLLTGLQLDDFWQRISLTRPPRWAPVAMPPLKLFTFFNDDPARRRWLMDQGIAAWWTDPQVRLAFFRPLSAATHWLDYQLWPDVPALMHAQSLAWYALVVALATALYRSIIGPGWVAAFAALIYAADHTHAIPAAWIANRNGLIATAFALASLALYDRARRGGGGLPSRIASPVLLALALCAGEAALGVVGFFAAYALYIDPVKVRRGALALAPHAVAVLVWLVVYRVGHFGVRGSGMYVDPLGAPIGFVEMAAVDLPLLLGAELGAPPPDAYALAPTAVRVALVVAALLALALAVAALAPVVRRSATARFFLVGAVIAVLPSCLTVPSGRTLLVPGFGLLGLVALAVAAALETSKRRKPLVIFAAWAGGVHVLLSPLLFQLGVAQVPILGSKFANLADSLGDAPALSRQRLVIVNAPDGAFTGYVSVQRWASGRSTPASLLSLAVGTRDVDIWRSDARTLTVRSAGGFIAGGTELLTRDPRHRMPPGTRVSIEGVVIEVVAATPDGRPALVRFTFDRPLEDPPLCWMTWRGGRLVPLLLPAIGGSAHIAAQSLLP